MVGFSPTLVFLLLTLQAATIYCQGHQHTQYVSRQQMTELKTEMNGKIAAVKSEWEEEKTSMDNEKNFWQHALLSLVEMLHSATSGTYNLWQYWTQQREAFQKVEDSIEDLREYIGIGTLKNPVSSCKDLRPNSTNGLYWLKNPEGNISQQYCAMDRNGCGTRGGWMRVAYVDMTQPGQECPSGFTTITTPKRLCGRIGQTGAGCISTKFFASNFPYTQVCGKVIAYQNNTPDGTCPYFLGTRTLEGAYIDGVSLTHGSPKTHIWSFIAGNGEAWKICLGCPCFSNYTWNSIPFIGNNFFCDTGSNFTARAHNPIFYIDDPLWDGEGCGLTNNCCTFNSPPWFSTELNETTTDELEMRICGNENSINEDTPIEHIELYVQ